MSESKYRWSYSDDYTCCVLYLRYAMSNAYNKDLEELTTRVAVELPQIKRSSIQMKLANIKWLSDHEPAARRLFPYGDGIGMSKGLKEFSAQCRRAFLRALKDVVPDPVVPDPDALDASDTVVPDPTIVNDFHPGDVISHNSFGIGTIIKAEGKDLWIKFSDVEKHLQLPEALKSIQKKTQNSSSNPVQPEVHGWTYEEEFLLCRLYLDHRYGNSSTLTQDELIRLATARLPGISINDAKNALEFVHGLMEREDEEIDEDDPNDELLLKKVLGHALKEFVKANFKDKRN